MHQGGVRRCCQCNRCSRDFTPDTSRKSTLKSERCSDQNQMPSSAKHGDLPMDVYPIILAIPPAR